MTPGKPVRVRQQRGRVVRDTHAHGSKSERVAVFLVTDDGRFVLRRKGGPAFGDAGVERYVGREVECDGFVVGDTLLAERIEVVE